MNERHVTNGKEELGGSKGRTCGVGKLTHRWMRWHKLRSTCDVHDRRVGTNPVESGSVASRADRLEGHDSSMME